MKVTNKEFSEQKGGFIEKCKRVFGDDLSNRQHKHLPLTRQASKFRMGKGIVYQSQ